MIHPLVPFRIRGAIWYQGESNRRRAYQYRKLFPTLIRFWRQVWDQGNFPFYFVQLAPYRYDDPDGSDSAELREAQLMTLSLPNTGMAVTMDIGNPGDIHPKNKQDVGKRLALWALAKTYGKKGIVHSGPIYRSMKVKGDKIYLSFRHTGSGLMVKGDSLTHFKVAGKDKIFVDARAVIEGNSIKVWSEGVPAPVAVRYAWTNAAEPNLFNKEGLPASSFRTDDWPGVTHKAR
jgi:sialate O-acetylesterase